MNRSISRVMGLAALLCLARVGAAAQQATQENPWGEVVNGLQLQATTGSGTDGLTESQLLLYVSLAIRNVSDKPVSISSMDTGQVTYDFEYEIDGTWYAFDPRTPVRTPMTSISASIHRPLEPGSSQHSFLTAPLAGRWPSLQLHAITADGAGKRFEPKRGPHVVRVRPGRTLIADRLAPISNAITITFRTPANIDTRSQSVTFVAARDTPLRELRFASGPADGQAFIREVLARPPYPASQSALINSAALQIVEPLPYYELWLQLSRKEPPAALPATTNRTYYLVLAGDTVAGNIRVESSRAGLVFNFYAATELRLEPVYRALQQLAGMEQVRGAGYEPRLLHVAGARGLTPLTVFWLRSSAGRPDLFYLPRDPDFRGWTKLESGRIYTVAAFLEAVQALPVTPRHDEAWAVDAAMKCAKAQPGKYTAPLFTDKAEVEIGLSRQQDHIVWGVFIPSPEEEGVMEIPAPGVAFTVDEKDGACMPIMRE